MSSRTYRILRAAAGAAYVVAGAAVVGLVTIALFFWIGQPWGTINDTALLVMTLAIAPLMLAFYELGGATPTPLARVAQVIGWMAVLTWCAVQALMITGVVTFEYSVRARGSFALEAAAQIVIGLWVAGANLLAGSWLGWIRWLGVVSGLGFVVLAAGLLRGGVNDSLTAVGGIGYQVVLPVWAFVMARLFGRIAALR